MRVLCVSMVSATESSEDEHKHKMEQRGEERTKGETCKLHKRKRAIGRQTCI